MLKGLLRQLRPFFPSIHMQPRGLTRPLCGGRRAELALGDDAGGCRKGDSTAAGVPGKGSVFPV